MEMMGVVDGRELGQQLHRAFGPVGDKAAGSKRERRRWRWLEGSLYLPLIGKPVNDDGKG